MYTKHVPVLFSKTIINRLGCVPAVRSVTLNARYVEYSACLSGRSYLAKSERSSVKSVVTVHKAYKMVLITVEGNDGDQIR